MRLRNGKIVIDVENIFFEKLDIFKKIIHDKQNFYKRYHDFHHYFYKIEDIFNFINNYLEDIHTLLMKNKKYKKKDIFLETIVYLEKHGKYFKNLNEGRIISNNKIYIEKHIKNVLEKIQNYKRIYKKEINDVLCRLLNKVNCDVINHINSYLICM